MRRKVANVLDNYTSLWMEGGSYRLPKALVIPDQTTTYRYTWLERCGPHTIYIIIYRLIEEL